MISCVHSCQMHLYFFIIGGNFPLLGPIHKLRNHLLSRGEDDQKMVILECVTCRYAYLGGGQKCMKMCLRMYCMEGSLAIKSSF